MKLYNAKTVARFLDLSERRVRQLRDEGVLTEVRAGLYDLEQAIKQYIHYLRDKQPDGGQPNYSTEKAKLAKAKRENEEYELALKKKELHRAEDVRLVMGNMLVNFKIRLMAIPAKVTPVLAKTADEGEVFTALKRILMKRWRSYLTLTVLF